MSKLTGSCVTDICALASIFVVTIFVGLFSMMRAVTRHPSWCPCHAENDELDYLEPDFGAPSKRTAP
jgi:hypothetical protein